MIIHIFVLSLLNILALDAVYGQSESYNDSVRLVNDFLKKYDHRIRPALNQTHPTKIEVTVNLMNLLTLDEIGQRMEVNIWINFTWYDEIRTWDPKDYGGIVVLHPDPLDVWRPRLLFSNSLEDRDVFEDTYAPFSILADGATKWYQGAIFKTSCDLDMTYFPYDEHICSIVFIGHDFAEEVNFVMTSEDVNMANFQENGEWEIISAKKNSQVAVFSNENLSRVRIDISVKRRPTFVVVNILIPVMFLSLMSFLVFILPKDSGERASYAITVLLSLSVFMSIVSGQLPQNSNDFPIIVMYLFVLLIMSSLSVIVTIIHLRWSSVFKNKCLKDKESINDELERETDLKNEEYIDNLMKNKPNTDKTLTTTGINTDKSTKRVNPGINQVRPLEESINDITLLERGKTESACTGVTTLLGRFMLKLVKNHDTVMFLLFCLTWLIVSLYFLCQLMF